MKVYIGIPFYGGAGAEFVSSLLKTHAALYLAGHEVEVDMHTNCSVLPKARNEILMRFVASGYDKLLFLDTDMKWDLGDVFTLLNSEHDFCGIDYVKKTENGGFVGTLSGRERDGWLQASYIGAGLLVVSRDSVQAMMQSYPDTRYVTDSGDVCFALFDFQIIEGRYWGEDYVFCKRWTDTGGEIAVLKDAATGHTGAKTYTGNRSDNVLH